MMMMVMMTGSAVATKEMLKKTKKSLFSSQLDVTAAVQDISPHANLLNDLKQTNQKPTEQIWKQKQQNYRAYPQYVHLCDSRAYRPSAFTPTSPAFLLQ